MVIGVRSGEDTGREVELSADRPLVLGRQQGCDVIVRDPRASRRHAELRLLSGGQVLLRDLGSANGTWVDGARVAEAFLGDGEELTIGDVRLGLALTPAAAAAPAVRLVPAQAEAPAPAPAAPTYSMIGALVDSRARRTNRLVAAVAGGLAVAASGLGALVLAAGGEAAPAERVPQVVAGAAPSTVLVESLRGGQRTGTGSGWVLDAGEGLVVTNAHVLNQGDAIRVAAGGRRRSARVVAAAPCEDVALLRVADADGLRTIALGEGGRVRQGETVVALGYPDGAGPADDLTSTTGVVSVARTTYRDTAPDVPVYEEAVQTDTALNPGNSGGPLIDLEGRLVGMNAAVRSAAEDGRALQNQNYAIAVDRLRAVVARLRDGRSPGWTGLTFAYPTPEQLATRRLPAGLLVTGAVRGTAADRAGVAAGAEALVGVDERPVGTTLASLCAAVGDGSPATLSFARPGGGEIRRVALGAR